MAKQYDPSLLVRFFETTTRRVKNFQSDPDIQNLAKKCLLGHSSSVAALVRYNACDWLDTQNQNKSSCTTQ